MARGRPERWKVPGNSDTIESKHPGDKAAALLRAEKPPGKGGGRKYGKAAADAALKFHAAHRMQQSRAE